MIELAVTSVITVGDALLEYREIIYLLALALVYRVTGKTRRDLWDGVLTTGVQITNAEKGIKREIQNGVQDELAEIRSGVKRVTERVDVLSSHVSSLARQVAGGQ